MSRRPTLLENQCAHVTLRCQNQYYLLDPSNHWEEISAWINCLPLFFDVEIHHFVVMSNHFHFMLTPKRNNFGQAMCYFTTNLSKYLNHYHHSINHIFGNRYCATVIEKEKHFMNVIRYIYQNPVRAGLVKNVTAYPFSSFGFYSSGYNSSGIRIIPDIYTKSLFNHGLSGWINWNELVGNMLHDDDVLHLKQNFCRFQFGFTKRQLLSIDMKKNITRYLKNMPRC